MFARFPHFIIPARSALQSEASARCLFAFASASPRLLTFLSNNEIYWFEIKVEGNIIMVKTEPPKGEIDIRVFHVLKDGRTDDDGFRELLQKFD